MIPELPKNVSDNDRVEFYNALWSNLSDQSSVHVNWHTHRGNPAVCWICDLFTLTSKLLDLYDKNISKSSLDMKTEHSSEDDSDAEIEDDSHECEDWESCDICNAPSKDYNEPEYDVEDEC